MKVKKLIKQLKEFDDSLKVYVETKNGFKDIAEVCVQVDEDNNINGVVLISVEWLEDCYAS